MSVKQFCSIRGPSSCLLPDRRSLGWFFFQQGQKYANKICQVNGNDNFSQTYTQILHEAVKLALLLKTKKLLTKSDLIMIYSGNTHNTIIPVLAGLFLGATVSFLPYTLLNPSEDTIKEYVTTKNPKILFVDNSDFIVRNRFDTESITKYTMVISLDSLWLNPCFEDHLEESQLAAFVPVTVDNRDIAVVFYSRGVTGQPKPVNGTHYHLLLKMNAVLQVEEINPKCIMHVNPISCTTSFIMLLVAFRTGGTRVICPHISPTRFMSSIGIFRVTYADTGCLNLEDFENVGLLFDTSSLHSLNLGRFPVTIYQLEAIRRLLRYSHVFLSYELTETLGPVAMQCYRKDCGPIYTPFLPTGRALCGVIIQISSFKKQVSLEPMTFGEIWVHVPNITHGYHRTADVGYFDENGLLYIVDRVKDAIIYEDHVIHPRLLEVTLEQFPLVKQTIIVELLEKFKGFQLGALVVPADKRRLTVEALNEYQKNLGVGLPPLLIKFIERIPRSVEGWISRKDLRKKFKKSKI